MCARSRQNTKKSIRRKVEAEMGLDEGALDGAEHRTAVSDFMAEAIVSRTLLSPVNGARLNSLSV